MTQLTLTSTKPKEKAYVLGVQAPRGHPVDTQEILGLAKALSLEVVHWSVCTLRQESVGLLLGKGWVEKVREEVQEHSVSVVVLDRDISSIQQRNLEKAWGVRVLDRTGLILGIFEKRAQSKEGKLQVRLAQLNYQKSRLVGLWSHLERQKSGGLFLGGPGEKQKELDRRMLEDKIGKIKQALVKVQQKRSLQRKSRGRVPLYIVALVGYTNAGKSTLFNRLTKSRVMAEDALFATLDPTMGLCSLPSGRLVVIADTVGFISRLPTLLIAAFRSTLEEVVEAHLILHVRDLSQSDREHHKRQVMKTLDSIGSEVLQKPILEVNNKIDQIPSSAVQEVKPQEIEISALKGDGITELLEAVDKALDRYDYLIELSSPSDHPHLLRWCLDQGALSKEQPMDRPIQVRLTPAAFGRLKKQLGTEGWRCLQAPTPGKSLEERW